MSAITINYSNTTRTQLPKATYFSTIRSVLKKYGITANVEIELRIVGQQQMRKLNSTFRHQDYATDVLSFPIWPNLATIRQRSQTDPILIGSIVVCLPIAQRQNQEINFLIEHSLLHLMGFHHEGD